MKRILAIALCLLLLCGAAQAEVTTTGDVNLRSGPGLDYGSLGTVRKGAVLEYLGQTRTDERGVDWYRVSTGATEGWVSSKYAELDEDEIAAPAVEISGYMLTDLRAAARTLSAWEYRHTAGLAPEQYADNAGLLLGGADHVTCIRLESPAYALFGARVGQDAGAAAAQLESMGWECFFDGPFSASYHLDRPDLTTCLNLRWNDGRVISIEWSVIEA